MIGRIAAIAPVLALAITSSAAAQRTPVSGVLAIALGAERRGDFNVAVENFKLVLQETPGNVQAVLGLSRILPAMERRAELVPFIARAVAVDSTNVELLSLGVRTHTMLGRADSAGRYVSRWAALYPGDEEPYREWAMSALEVRDRAAARQALEAGRRQIGHPAALAPELAQLRLTDGDHPGAADEWVRAVSNAAVYRGGALLTLGSIPPDTREQVLARLAANRDPEAKRIAGLLLIKWGRPEDGVAMVASSIPEQQQAAAMLMQQVFDQLKGRNDAAARRARARALEAQADRQEGAERVRLRMEAARAWADAGREAEARRLLEMVSDDPAAPEGISTSASSALLGVLIAERKPEQAESLLKVMQPNQSLDDRERDARRVAFAWALAGDIPRGEALVASDSSVTGLALRGVLRAFAGDLATAAVWLEAAGPYDEQRENSVERVRLLALLQLIDREQLPALGGALLTLARGDTVAAVAALLRAGEALEPPAQAALQHYAGELSLALGDTLEALTQLRLADTMAAPATAPAARLLIARILTAQGNPDQADAMLEQLIIDFPDSAVVPAARRMRDANRGAVPGSGAR